MISHTITEIEAQLAEAGVSVDALCRAAGVARSTWVRWKAGKTTPNMRTWGEIERALSQLLAPVEAQPEGDAA